MLSNYTTAAAQPAYPRRRAAFDPKSTHNEVNGPSRAVTVWVLDDIICSEFGSTFHAECSGMVESSIEGRRA